MAGKGLLWNEAPSRDSPESVDQPTAKRRRPFSLVLRDFELDTRIRVGTGVRVNPNNAPPGSLSRIAESGENPSSILDPRARRGGKRIVSELRRASSIAPKAPPPKNPVLNERRCRRFYERRRGGILPLIHPHQPLAPELLSLENHSDHFDSVGLTRIRPGYEGTSRHNPPVQPFVILCLICVLCVLCG
jgi:hypothetical protein